MERMDRYYYKTIFDNDFNAYYMYYTDTCILGCIPCGIYVREDLSTIHIMNLVHKLWLISHFPRNELCHAMYEWRLPDGSINMNLFNSVTSRLECNVQYYTRP